MNKNKSIILKDSNEDMLAPDPNRKGTAKKNKKFVLLLSSYGSGSNDYSLVSQLCEGLKSMGTIEALTIQDSSLNSYQKAVQHSDAQLFLTSDLQKSIAGLVQSLRIGCIPIVPSIAKMNGIVENFDPTKEKGNGFIYAKEDIWHVFAAIIRAYENYRFPYDWQNLVEAARRS